MVFTDQYHIKIPTSGRYMSKYIVIEMQNGNIGSNNWPCDYHEPETAKQTEDSEVA